MEVQLAVAKARWNRRVTSRCIRKGLLSGKRYVGKRKNHLKPKWSFKLFRVVSPEVLDLFSPQNHRSTVNFIEKLHTAVRSASLGNGKVHVCFRNLMRISASGGIYLLANTDWLTKIYPSVKFMVSKPPAAPEGKNKAPRPVVHSVLKQIGFYRLVGQPTPKLPQLPHVDCWQVATADDASGELLGEAIEKAAKFGLNSKALYRSAIEALSNASEHAYHANVPTTRNFPIRRWWLFSAVLENQLHFYICDLGHGIPKTLVHTQKSDLLAMIKQRINAIIPNTKTSAFVGDVLDIKASTMVKETRTDLEHRGKGGSDVKSLV